MDKPMGSLCIGMVKIDPPVVLAPLAGVTDGAFRLLVKEYGCGLTVTEMISAKGLIYKNRESNEMIRTSDVERPVAVQLFGSEPEVIAEAIRLVYAAEMADLIDLNMGCPVPKVVRSGEGSALMREPDLAGRIVAAAVAASPLPVTVKMRIGWDPDSINAVEFAQRIEECGVSAIAVHGRTRSQYYGGAADWETIARVKAAVGVPVIGNGDVWNPQAAQRLLEQTGCDGVMIGRGAMGAPWLPGQVAHFLTTGEEKPDPSVRERMEIASRHLHMLVENKGEWTGVRQMRTHAAWYTKGLRGASRVRGRINALDTMDEMLALFSEIVTEFGDK